MGKNILFLWNLEARVNPRSPTFQAGSFNQGPRPIWDLANQASNVLRINILTFWWLEYRMSKVLTF